MMPTPLATCSPRLSGVLLRAKIARQCPVGTSMTRPVRTSAISRGRTVMSWAAAKSKPAASSVPYAGRGIVESSRLSLSRIRAAYLAVLMLLVSAAAGFAQDLAARLPLDAQIRTGTLPNGLTYFIRKNDEPDDRAFLRLAVKAGSIDEADDQRGLAHVLEHMAFNGGRHFPPGELVKYLESIGAQFGPHVNAYTSFDETVYMLNVPTNRAGVLTRGLEAMSDFAGGITLDSAEIDKERGVVIEEWRGRLGANERMQEPQLRALFGGSRSTDRLPIGTPEILKSFPHQRLRAF